MSLPKSEPTLVAVTIHLSGGQQCRTELPSDSDILRQLFEALADGTDGLPAAGARLLQIPADDGRRAYTFSSTRLVAIETSPPVLVELPAQEDLRHSRQDPSARLPRRSPPVVRLPPGVKSIPPETPEDAH